MSCGSSCSPDCDQSPLGTPPAPFAPRGLAWFWNAASPALSPALSPATTEALLRLKFPAGPCAQGFGDGGGMGRPEGHVLPPRQGSGNPSAGWPCREASRSARVSRGGKGARRHHRALPCGSGSSQHPAPRRSSGRSSEGDTSVLVSEVREAQGRWGGARSVPGKVASERTVSPEPVLLTPGARTPELPVLRDSGPAAAAAALPGGPGSGWWRQARGAPGAGLAFPQPSAVTRSSAVGLSSRLSLLSHKSSWEPSFPAPTSPSPPRARE